MITLRADTVAWQEVDGQLVLLDTRTSRYLGVNHTGTIMWPRIVEGCTADELTGHLASVLGLPPQAVRADVEAFVDELKGRGMVDVSP